jgi:hypothetical protein
MPDLLYEHLTFSGIDDAVERFRAFAKAHTDFEPTLACERDRGGRRRWVLSVGKRTEAEAAAQRRNRVGAEGDE